MNQPIEQWGYFDDQARQFVLTTPTPPRPWKNILWNERFNTQPTNCGGGIAYRRDEDGFVNLLHWTGTRCIYIVDLDSAQAFSLGYAPLCNPSLTEYECRFGLNEHTITQTCCDIDAQSITIVPVDDTCELMRLRIADRAGAARRLRVIALNDLNLSYNDKYFGTHNVFVGRVTDDRRSLGVFNETYLADRLSMAYFAADRAFDAYSLQAADLLGEYGAPARPAHLLDFSANSLELFDAPSMVTAFDLALEANGEATLHLALGCVEEAAAFSEAGRRHLSAAAFDEARDRVAQRVDQRYSSVNVATPDASFDRFANTWIKHQTAYCADWNRGWGKGFRDGMQDAWGYAAVEPEKTKRMIPDALPHQFADGRTLRKWAPVDAKPYNDGGIWLIFAADAYLRETGDFAFLDDAFGFFESEDRGSVFEHMWRAVQHLADGRGERGLCRMPFGDWNDQLTGPGKGGKGESVWTTLALVAALPVVQRVAERIGQTDRAARCEAWRSEIATALQTHGWNGQWFNRAITDEGKPIGHPDCEAGRIFLLPQAWSLLADVASDEQRDAVVAACDKHLAAAHGYLLMGPPYRKYDPSVGHLSGAIPGTVENGSNYCHASSFMVSALAHAGKVDQALAVWKKLLPTNELHPPSISRQEPFSMTNTYRGPDAGPSAGRSLFSWRTGTAGWAFRNALEAVLGVRAEFDGLRIRDTLPSDWNHATMTRRYRDMTITIEWQRTGEANWTVDGKPCPGPVVPLDMLRDGAKITCSVDSLIR